MGSSRIIATRRRSVYMAHICSRCGFPVISIVTIEAKSEKTYTFSQQKATQIASETAEQAIVDEIQTIENCRINKRPLVSGDNKDSMIALGYFCSSSFSGHTTSCPYCSNVEPWQKSGQNNQDAFLALKEDSYPQVFQDAESADEWARTKVISITAQIDAVRSNNNIEVTSCAHKSVASVQRIAEWEKQLSSIPELETQKVIEDQLASLRMRKDALGVLDIRGRKEINTKIRINELKLKDINSIISERETPIREIIISERISLVYTQAVAFGYSKEVLSKKKQNTFAYFYSPNPIPDEYSRREIQPNGISEQKPPEVHQVQKEGFLSEKKDDGATRFCRKCGYKLLPDSVFCTKCGTKVEEIN